jgi:chorismate dehydratase
LDSRVFWPPKKFGRCRWIDAMKIRISLVYYLNSAPLGWAFLHGPFRERYEVVPSSPARCADQLSSGEVDIGLIPSIEYQLMPNLQIIPEISMSSLAEVRSILLIRPKKKQSIQSVALDTSSRTSVALVRILLETKMGIHPNFVPCPPDLDLMLSRCDAALLIGDAALKVPLESYDTKDLAAEWVQWQRKPFVCAFWACRPEAAGSPDLNAVFWEAKIWGLKRRSEIAEAYAEVLSLPVSFLEEYLINNIDYEMGPEHIEGLKKFYQLAHQQKLVPNLHPLQFVPSGKIASM